MSDSENEKYATWVAHNIMTRADLARLRGEDILNVVRAALAFVDVDPGPHPSPSLDALIESAIKFGKLSSGAQPNASVGRHLGRVARDYYRAFMTAVPREGLDARHGKQTEDT